MFRELRNQRRDKSNSENMKDLENYGLRLAWHWLLG
jgi:hypothetical protein